jgi:hypothetical protein
MKGQTLFLKGNDRIPYQFEIIDNGDHFLIRSKGINKENIKQHLCDLVNNCKILNYTDRLI